MLNKTFMNKNYLPLWFASKTVHLCLMVLGVATGGGIERVQVNKPSVTRSIWSGSFPLPDVRQKPSNRPITVLHTPRKINMEPKDSPNWKGTSSSKPSFSGCMFNLPGCISEANNTQFSPPLFFFFDASCPFTLHVVKAHHTLCQRFQKSRSCATTQLEALTHLSC